MPKGRPRFTVKGGFPRAYTPEKTAKYEKLVKAAGVRAMRGRAPIAEPVSVTAICRFSVPKSKPRKFREAALADKLRPGGPNDLENLLKALMDGLNGTVFEDDSQIVEIRAAKLYGDTPGVTIIIDPWSAPEVAPVGP